MNSTYAFDDRRRQCEIRQPILPRPWINYLGNRRLTAFISHNAGGLLWWQEPQTRRITRYHYTAAPGDRPGFYVYVHDRETGRTWNPHFAPTCTELDCFACRHEPGVTSFSGRRDGIEVAVSYAIPPGDDAFLWQVTVRNRQRRAAAVSLASYIEFGLLEFLRETIGWCYLKNQFSLRYDPALRAIRYDYHVFEAPHCPRMLFGCTAEVAGWECSREAFIGPAGSLERPGPFTRDGRLSDSDLPLGGHACGTLGVELELAAGQSASFAYVFTLGATWDEAEARLRRYGSAEAAAAGLASVRTFWNERLSSLQASTGDADADRMINTWNPYNAAVALELARIISTDHMGTDGLRYRDTTQDAHAVANFDPDFAADRMRLVFAQQKRDGMGCFSFFPGNSIPTSDAPRRCDNTVWQIYTVGNLLAETGNLGLLDERIPFRDGGDATVYGHILLGLKYIYDRRGPRGLPTLYHADWNDGLALFQDEAAESVMLAQQLVYSCRLFADLAKRLGRDADAAWCAAVIAELGRLLNSDLVWDGGWYRRLLLSNGKCLGSAANRQGAIYVNPQSWAVISGIGDVEGRGRIAMDAVAERLDTDCGIRILAPPFTGIPEPEDPPLGSNPGIGENGGIFCHANTWAIIAEALLGNAGRAFKYYRQLIPAVAADRAGIAHYGREPYVYVSSIVGPPSERFGEAGISWLTGTASWMYVAVTQYLLGVRPTLDGLVLRPCLPADLREVRVRRRYRGCDYDIVIENTGRGTVALEVNGAPWAGDRLPVEPGGRLRVRCRC